MLPHLISRSTKACCKNVACVICNATSFQRLWYLLRSSRAKVNGPQKDKIHSIIRFSLKSTYMLRSWIVVNKLRVEGPCSQWIPWFSYKCLVCSCQNRKYIWNLLKYAQKWNQLEMHKAKTSDLWTREWRMYLQVMHSEMLLLAPKLQTALNPVVLCKRWILLGLF